MAMKMPARDNMTEQELSAANPKWRELCNYTEADLYYIHQLLTEKHGIESHRPEGLFGAIFNSEPLKLDGNEKTLGVREAISQFQTGDVILFSGNASASRRLRQLLDSKFSHVAIVVRLSDDQVYIWHSTTSSSFDAFSEAEHPGVQLVPAKIFFNQYIPLGSLVWRQLRPFLPAEKSEEEVRWSYTNSLVPLLIKYSNFNYPDPKNFLGEVLKGYLPNKFLADPETFFCSQLVATAFQALELLPKSPDPRWYTPKHFAIEECGYLTEKKLLSFNEPYVIVAQEEK